MPSTKEYSGRSSDQKGRARDAVAQVAGVAAKEIRQVSDLKAHQIERMAHVVPVEGDACGGPVVGEQGIERGQERALAVVRLERPGVRGDGAGGLRRCRFRRGREEIGLEYMRHRECRGLGNGGLRQRDGVAGTDVEGGDGLVVLNFG